MTATVHNLDDLLGASAATDEFKSAVKQLESGGRPEKILFNAGCPPVKVLRTITKLLEAEPTLAVDSVLIDAMSGCSDFTGTLTVNGGEARFSFTWDCAWRAKQAQYVDGFGLPDQIRAAREFGYQCFEKFDRTA